VVVLDDTGDVVVDLGDPDGVRRAATLVLDRYGRCDVSSTQRRRSRSGRLIRSN
jgi:hypothetical protein